MKSKYKALWVSGVSFLVLLFLFKNFSISMQYAKDGTSQHQSSLQSNSNLSTRTVDRQVTTKTNRGIQSKSFSLTAEEFECQWDEIFRLYNSPESRGIELSQLVLKMTMSGEGEYALSKVTSAIGEGKTRERLIESIFSEISDAETSEKLFSLLSANDFGAAANGTKWLIASVLKQSIKDGTSYDFNKFSFLKNHYDSVMSDAIEQCAFEMYREDVSPDLILDSIASFNIPENRKVAALVWLSSLDAFVVHTYIEKNQLQLSEEDQHELLQNMLQSDPVKVFEFVKKSDHVDYNTKFGLLRDLLSYDKNADISQITQSDKELNYAYLHLVSLEKIQSNNVTEAWDYVNQITDPVIKKKAEGQVWSRERDMVRNAVNQDPQQAITELVSGKSQHDAYWIEEAMDVWMQKDFDKAEKWYGDNWKSLPAEKVQYAAAAFAKQAIKAGDVDAAAQWLPYIQDPKTKERIQGDLDKALKN